MSPRQFNPTKIKAPSGVTPISPELWNAFNFHDLEIGCGVGWHPIQYSLNHPDRMHIALERTRDKFAKFQSRLESHSEINNLQAIHADAIPWIVHFLPENSLDRIFILYPNPYPKNPAARFFNMPFMDFLLKRLKPSGELILATNIESYLQEAIENHQKFFRLKIKSLRTLDKLATPRTHFEKKYLERGEKCFELILMKDPLHG